MEDMQKDYVKAKKAGEVAEEVFRDFNHWLQGFLIFSAYYLETRPGEHANVVKDLFLIIELFLGNKAPLWQDYDKKFRKKQCGNPILPLGFKDVEVWLEVVGGTGAWGQRSVAGQPKRQGRN